MGFLRQLWTGRRLVNSMVSGEFDDSRVGQQFASWFREPPAREEQRQIFVQITTGLHCPTGMVDAVRRERQEADTTLTEAEIHRQALALAESAALKAMRNES